LTGRFRPLPELLRCATCEAGITFERVAGGAATRCPACGAETQYELYPALLRPRADAHVAPAILMDDESSCFYHPTKQAAVPCDRCGRFLCNLCDFEIDGEHLCPACLESGKSKGDVARLQTTRTRYDVIAFSLSLVPFLFMLIPVVFTGPAIIYMYLRYGRAKEGQPPLGVGWFIGAGLMSLFQAAILAIFAIALIGESMGSY
jgi:hypothetical protein